MESLFDAILEVLSSSRGVVDASSHDVSGCCLRLFVGWLVPPCVERFFISPARSVNDMALMV